MQEPRMSAQQLRTACTELLLRDKVAVHGISLSQWQRWETGESAAEYATRMRHASQWGGGVELLAIAHLLCAEVAVHVKDLGGAISSTAVAAFKPACTTTHPPIRLLYDRAHYTIAYSTPSNLEHAQINIDAEH